MKRLLLMALASAPALAMTGHGGYGMVMNDNPVVSLVRIDQLEVAGDGDPNHAGHEAVGRGVGVGTADSARPPVSGRGAAGRADGRCMRPGAAVRGGGGPTEQSVRRVRPFRAGARVRPGLAIRCGPCVRANASAQLVFVAWPP